MNQTLASSNHLTAYSLNHKRRENSVDKEQYDRWRMNTGCGLQAVANRLAKRMTILRSWASRYWNQGIIAWDGFCMNEISFDALNVADGCVEIGITWHSISIRHWDIDKGSFNHLQSFFPFVHHAACFPCRSLPVFHWWEYREKAYHFMPGQHRRLAKSRIFSRSTNLYLFAALLQAYEILAPINHSLQPVYPRVSSSSSFMLSEAWHLDHKTHSMIDSSPTHSVTVIKASRPGHGLRGHCFKISNR